MCSSLREDSSRLGRLDDGDETPGHRSHDGGGDQRCLTAIAPVAEVGRHAAEAEEEDAGAEEQNLEQGGRISTVCLRTGPQANADAEVSEVAGEVRGADGQGAASSGDAVLDALRECPQQQRLGSGVVAHAGLRLAVVDHAAEGHGEGCGQQVRRVAALVDCLLIALAEAGHERSRSKGGDQVEELGAPIRDQASGWKTARGPFGPPCPEVQPSLHG